MTRPTTKAALAAASASEFDRLWVAVALVPPELRLVPGPCDQWSVKDLLAHLDGWHELLLGWQRSADAGLKPAIPAPGFSWRDTPALNEQIRARYSDMELLEVEDRLRRSFEEVSALIARYDDPDLFTRGRYPWTGSTSVGSYLVSATSSHYAWASSLIRRWVKAGCPVTT